MYKFFLIIVLSTYLQASNNIATESNNPLDQYTLRHIFCYLDQRSLSAAGTVCQTWMRTVNEDHQWINSILTDDNPIKKWSFCYSNLKLTAKQLKILSNKYRLLKKFDRDTLNVNLNLEIGYYFMSKNNPDIVTAFNNLLIAFNDNQTNDKSQTIGFNLFLNRNFLQQFNWDPSPAIQHLDLSNNCLSEFPTALKYLSGLRSINFNYNFIRNFDNCIDGLTSLKFIYLRGNQLSTNQHQFNNLNNLQEFDVRDNVDLDQLPLDLKTQRNLTVLGIANTKIVLHDLDLGNKVILLRSLTTL